VVNYRVVEWLSSRKGHLVTERRDEMRWDEMRWDEMRWDEMRWDEMRWDEVTRWYSTAHHRLWHNEKWIAHLHSYKTIQTGPLCKLHYHCQRDRHHWLTRKLPGLSVGEMLMKASNTRSLGNAWRKRTGSSGVSWAKDNVVKEVINNSLINRSIEMPWFIFS